MTLSAQLGTTPLAYSLSSASSIGFAILLAVSMSFAFPSQFKERGNEVPSESRAHFCVSCANSLSQYELRGSFTVHLKPVALYAVSTSSEQNTLIPRPVKNLLIWKMSPACTGPKGKGSDLFVIYVIPLYITTRFRTPKCQPSS